MAEHPNVANHRRGHEAFRTGDVEALRALFADDTRWHWPGKSEIGGDVEGRDAVLALLGKFGSMADTMEFVVEDYLASDSRTAALSHMKVTRGGKAYEFDACEILRWEGGKVAEEWLLVEDVYAFDEFWS